MGVFIGAWGVADALVCFGGTMLSGILCEVSGYAKGSVYAGYVVAFGTEIALFGVSLLLLKNIKVTAFPCHDTTREMIAAAEGSKRVGSNEWRVGVASCAPTTH